MSRFSSSSALCVALRVALMALLGNGQVMEAGYWDGLLIGFAGHGLGIIVVAPLFLTWNAEPRLSARQLEFGLLIAATVALNVIGFSITIAAPGSTILYAIFIAVLWAALRFGPRETTLVIAITGIFATWAAGSGSGPFMLSNQSEALISLSLFLFVATATALFLAAAASERDLYLQRVVESEHAQRALIDQIAEGVITLDLEGRLEFASEQFCALCGKAQDKLIGLRLGDLMHTHRGAAPAELLAGQDVEAEASIDVLGQGKRKLLITTRRMTDASGRPTGAMAVVADITERRKAEERAQQHLRQLAHIGRVKSLDEMAVAIAHEVAQPLTAITAYVQAAQRFLKFSAVDRRTVQEALDGAYSQARRASTIVSRIRAFAQDRPWQPIDLPVHELLADAAHFAEPEARQHGARLMLAPGCRQCLIHGDPIQLQQVLINLIRNAAEAMSDQVDSERRITLVAQRANGGQIDIAVSDGGPGIDASLQENLFEAFFTTKENGVGIGLALCRSIIDAHGGKLWAESPAAGGTVFHIVLREVAHE